MTTTERPPARKKGPSASRILAAAGATAAGIVLVGVMGASAGKGDSTPSPEVRTVTIQVPASGSGSAFVSEEVTVRPAPVERQADRVAVTETGGS
jgi:hypothetical protein